MRRDEGLAMGHTGAFSYLCSGLIFQVKSLLWLTGHEGREKNMDQPEVGKSSDTVYKMR